MRPILIALTALIASPALAQSAPATASAAPARYDLAPWWMREAIIASTGFAETEMPTNRARFAASFQVVDKDAATATRLASEKIKALGGILADYGAGEVRVETGFSTQPLYDQYRDKDGNLIDNRRADKIERYEVTAVLRVEVRDLRLIERVYATVLSAKPSSADQVSFTLEADNESRTQIFSDAVRDASRRARLAVTAAGGSLGAVKLIDPTGRACQTDVLVAGADRNGAGVYPQTYAAPPMAMSAPAEMSRALKAESDAGLNPDQFMLPLQAPLQKLSATACVIYGLLP